MINKLTDTTTLNNGVKMPWFGLGVFKAEAGEEVENAVKTALQLGYRSIDTAAFYKNEEGVGKAIRESGVKREDIFVTTKVWNENQGYDSTLEAFEESRKKLGLDYIDLYLVHWPVKGKYLDTWKALEKLYKDGLVRAIGVSNFKIHHLKDILNEGEIVPTVNQVEYHPRLTQSELHHFCKEHQIQLEAWSPLMRGGELLEHPDILDLSKKYGKTSAQIILRWDLEKEVVTIPKSVHDYRIKENADIFDFELSEEDIKKIDDLNKDQRIGPDPDHINF